MSELAGRHEHNVAEVFEHDPGGYCPVINDEGVVTALWFKLPTGSVGRIAAEGHGTNEEPEWTITMVDGCVNVEPSILQKEYEDSDPPILYWHGYLRNGVWEF